MKVRVYLMREKGLALPRETVFSRSPISGDVQIVETTARGTNQIIRVARLRTDDGRMLQIEKAKLIWARRNKMAIKGHEKIQEGYGLTSYAQNWLMICDRLPACRMMQMRDRGVEIGRGWDERMARKGDFSFVDRHQTEERRSMPVAQLEVSGGHFSHKLYDAELLSLRDNFFVVLGYERLGETGEVPEYVQRWHIRLGYEEEMPASEIVPSWQRRK